MKKVKLSDISLETGKYGIPAISEEYSELHYRYLRITDIAPDGTLINDNKKSISSKEASDYLLSKNDIVFARTGNSTGKSFFYEPKYGDLVYAGFLIKFKLDENKVNPKFIKYYTISSRYIAWVESFQDGSTRGNLNAQSFANMELDLPSREQQDTLVQVLSTIDDKIEVNKKINEELEQMARELYDYWFVQFDFPNAEGKPYKASGGDMVYSDVLKLFLPKGWSVTDINSVSTIIAGQSPKSEFYNSEGNGIPFLQGNRTFKTFYPEIDTWTALSKKTVEDKTILVSVRAPVGAMNIANQAVSIGRGIVGIIEKNNHQEFLWYLLKSNVKNIISNSSGSTYESISSDTLKKINIVYPPENLIYKFDRVVVSIYNKIKINCEEIIKLEEIKDKLLPMLMNGQVNIKKDR